MNERHLNDCKKEFENARISKKKDFWKGMTVDVLHGDPERAAMWVLHCEDVQYAREVVQEIYRSKLNELTKEIGIIHELMRLVGID